MTRQIKRSHQLVIDSRQTIESIQNDFNGIYPFLKLGFFRIPVSKGKGDAKAHMYSTHEKIYQIQKKNSNHFYTLPANISVSDLEITFEKEFGLYVQVFRKSGNLWLETTATDDWTLEEQNEEGKNLYEHFKEEKEKSEDHDIFINQ